MLTWKELEGQLDIGGLAKWHPSKHARTGSDGRCLYMLKDVYDGIQARPWPTTQVLPANKAKLRRAAMRAVLQRFVEGSHLNLNYDMKELGSMKTQAEMQGFWEFRSGPPAEQSRLFGFFARPGAFVATSFKPRGLFGGASDPRWLEERQAGEARWRAAFGSRNYMKTPWPVHTSGHFREYLDHIDDE